MAFGATAPPKPVTVSQSEAIASGYVHYSRVEHDDGSVTYTYGLSNGISINETTPPPGFSPLTASDQELSRYGFPVRPSSPADLADWTNVMGSWRNSPPPLLTFTEGLSAQTAQPQAGGGNTPGADYGAGQWAGWYDYSAYPGYYYAVQSHITVPNIGAACTNAGTEPGIWAGLGGTTDFNGSTSLLQAGVAALAFPNEPTVWQPFWEAISSTSSNPPIQFRNANGLLSINPLDQVWTQVGGTSNPNSYVFFFFEDLRTGQSASFSLTGTSGYGNPAQYYDGRTAEWMMEFPTGLAPFSSYEFTQAGAGIAGTSGWTSIVNSPHQIINNYGTSLTVGGLGTGGADFAEFFNHC